MINSPELSSVGVKQVMEIPCVSVSGGMVSSLNNWDKIGARTDGGDGAHLSFSRHCLSRTEDSGLEHKAGLDRVCPMNASWSFRGGF